MKNASVVISITCFAEACVIRKCVIMCVYSLQRYNFNFFSHPKLYHLLIERLSSTLLENGRDYRNNNHFYFTVKYRVLHSIRLLLLRIYTGDASLLLLPRPLYLDAPSHRERHLHDRFTIIQRYSQANS